jgi:tRNA-specific 2-thiouridylase
VDVERGIVGEHRGAAAYTVGQRQGLGVALGEPRYVSRVDAATNTIQIARRADLETTTVPLERVTFVDGAPPAGRATAFRAQLRIRHRARPVAATIAPATSGEPDRGGSWVATTDEPVWAAAPGQAAVLYDGDVALGGGRISRGVPAALQAGAA